MEAEKRHRHLGRAVGKPNPNGYQELIHILFFFELSGQTRRPSIFLFSITKIKNSIIENI